MFPALLCIAKRKVSKSTYSTFPPISAILSKTTSSHTHTIFCLFHSLPQNMAFVPTAAVKLSARTSFHGVAIDAPVAQRVASQRVASWRMSDDKESPAYGKAGDSMWKENPFTGGIPGGETFYRSWIESGMKGDFPDLPDSLQPKTDFNPPSEEADGLLAKLDEIEFFPKFVSKKTKELPIEQSPSAAPDLSEQRGVPELVIDRNAAPEPVIEQRAAPEPVTVIDEVEKYFPAERRNLAPFLDIVHTKDCIEDRVYLAMKEVTASATDLYYPKHRKNKAPVIEIQYYGSLAAASVSVSMPVIEPLPTIPPPPRVGDAVTTLVPGSGGGLKLNYQVLGEGPINI